MEYHEQLRDKRRKKDWTQERLAEEVSKRRGKKLDRSQVSRWENGVAFPNPENNKILREIYA